VFAGVAVFEKLHSRAHDGEAFLYAFDPLDLDGEDCRPRPLEERKAKLQKLLAKAPTGIQFSEHLEGDGAAISRMPAGWGPRALSPSTASTLIALAPPRPGSRPRIRWRRACCGSRTTSRDRPPRRCPWPAGERALYSIPVASGNGRKP
jgi:hypothetical protein